VQATSSPSDLETDARRLLAAFGLSSFRPGQAEAVEAALCGRDSLVVMPTGGGKSLCYQLPALAWGDGHPERLLVVVVSPLIALMSDQLRRLQDAGVRAAMLASGMAEGHNEARLREIAAGETQLVLAAPERFASGAFRRALGERRVGLFVVDEAHCVAEWGHDFRPDYLRLGEAIDELSAHAGRPAVMAATATATPRVAAEIERRLGLHDPVRVRSGFDRPNLVFDVVSVEGKGAVARKRAALLGVLAREHALPAIVYAGTRKDTEVLCEEIGASGLSAVAYHAGLSPERRRAAQEAFMSGEAEVVVATNAFGMGVDKADVRTVAHWALPTSLESYYQEAGRGGRDGAPARALLLASRMDLGRLIRFIKERETTVADVRAFVGRLRAGAGEDGVAAVAHGALSERERVLLSIAERAGAAELEPGGAAGLLVRLTGRGSPRLAAGAIRAARDRAWESYRSIERYSSSGERCRRRQILDHFGDEEQTRASGRCCDVCDPDAELAATMAAAEVRAGSGRARSRPRDGGARGGGGAGARTRPAGAMREAPEYEVPSDQFEALRVWRLERSEGKPAFTVASDATLRELLHRRPRTRGELLAVRGIGPSFCEKHGESLLSKLAGLAAGDSPVSQPSGG
jgi:ATP-dependent DNA helicase RecQ